MEKIVIQGLGFVGLAMATVIANATDKEDDPVFDKVVGVDLPEKQRLINTVNKGIMPFKTEDGDFSKELKKAVKDFNNLKATSSVKEYRDADVVIVDVQLDIEKVEFGSASNFKLKDDSFKKAIKTLGENISPQCLVIIETTVPPGFTRKVVNNILQEEFKNRGIDINDNPPRIAHSYERVMPGENYLDSIRNFFRTFSGLDEVSTRKTKRFLSKIINTNDYPLKREEVPEASELAKVLENTYRSVNIALIYEWTLLAENMGVNLFSVLEGIKKRETHKNIMAPGFGVGGYCLPKDSLLAQWSAKNIYNTDFGLPLSLEAININDKMPLHTYDLIVDNIKKKDFSVAILGVSYRENVGDTRNSPTKTLYNKLSDNDIYTVVYDSFVDVWEENSKAEFINELKQIKNFDCIVLAVRHKEFMQKSKYDWSNLIRENMLVVDANNILNDEKIKYLLKQGINVVGVGKGHIDRFKKGDN